MVLRETSTSTVENARRMTDAEHIERVSGNAVQTNRHEEHHRSHATKFTLFSSELHRSVRETCSSSYALYYPSAGRSLFQIDRSYHGRRRRRRWKFSNCLRRTSSVRDETYNARNREISRTRSTTRKSLRATRRALE